MHSVSYRGATRREMRGTGYVVGGALAVLGILQLVLHGRLSHPPAIYMLFGASAVLLLLAALTPGLLRPFHWAWMKLAEGLGWVMNRVLLGITFFVLFTLTGLIVRLVRRDALHLDFRAKRESYWRLRPGEPPPPERYERQF